MNSKSSQAMLAFSLLAFTFLAACGGSSHSNSGGNTTPVVAIAATSGGTQSATVGAAFAAPLVATVTTNGTGTAGVSVVFTAPSSGASGTFANGTATETDTTNSSGVATSSAFTANSTSGSYSVTAAASGAATPASFGLTNNAAAATTSNFSFYLSGQEAINAGGTSSNYYALAGSVTIDSNGNVTTGEQDYNDAFGLTSPEPSPDTITGGTLTVDSTTGQGTLTLITSNTTLGVSGTETLGVQFVNVNHALIVQFDGTATSSGSMDLQNLASAPSGNYAFALSGVDINYSALVVGGVLSISGTTIPSGTVDVDDDGTVTTGTAFTGTITPPDASGRGTLTGFGLTNYSFVYYVVGPEVLRVIDVDATDSAIGSAFGQGTQTYDDTALGSSVFGIEEGNNFGATFATAGMITTTPGSGTFAGVADDDEYGTAYADQTISGTYTISGTGYGNLTVTSANLGSVNVVGLYLTDPTLNLTDPNNTTSGLGGALLVDLDSALGGTGYLVPQTDSTSASFTGNYAFGAQVYDGFNQNAVSDEFDFIGQGSVTSGAFSGTGIVSDPFFNLNSSTGAATTYTGVTFSGTPLADPSNPGRYTLSATNTTPNPLVMTPTAPAPVVDFTVAIYQGNGGLLFWVDEDVESLFLGTLQQQGSLTGLPAAKKPVAASKSTKKK
jgi:hypothetical protein